MTPERIEELMVKVVDRVATPAEEEELMSALSGEPELQRELDAHRALKAVTDGWVDRLEADLAEDRHRRQPLTRIERRVGVSLAVVGTAVLGGGGLVTALLDESAPLWVRLGLGTLTAAVLVLLFAVVRWRLSVRESDPYTEVIR